MMTRKRNFYTTKKSHVVLKHGYMKLEGMTVNQAFILELVCRYNKKRIFPFTFKSVSQETGISRQTILNSFKLFLGKGLFELEDGYYRMTQKLVDLNDSLLENILIDRYSLINISDFKISGLNLYEYCFFLSVRKLHKEKGYMWGGYDNMQRHLGISRRYLFEIKNSLTKKGFITDSTFVNIEPKVIWKNILEVNDDYDLN